MVVQGKGHPCLLERTCRYFSMKLNNGFRLSSWISICAACESHLQRQRHEWWWGPSQHTQPSPWAAASAASTETKVAAWECCLSSPFFLFFLSLPQCLPHLHLKRSEDPQSGDKAWSSHFNPLQWHCRVCENCPSGCLLSTSSWEHVPSC